MDVPVPVETDLKRSAIPRRIARAAEIAVGLVFIIEGLLKAADINIFIVQISRYGIPTFSVPVYIAFYVLIIELVLGTLLVLGPRLRRTLLSITVALLVFYTALIVYGWLSLGLDDCGCSGPVPMHPAVGIAKNVLLLAACFVAWKGLVPLARGPKRKWAVRAFIALARLGLAVAIAYGAVYYAVSRVEAVRPEIMGPRPFDAYEISTEAATWDLGKGEYFVAMLSTTCSHCQKSIAPLNELSRRSGFPRVVGLCKGNPAEFERFLLKTHPQFPMHVIGVREFYNLIAMGPPRFILERDGKPVKVWDGLLPSFEDVAEAREQKGIPDA